MMISPGSEEKNILISSPYRQDPRERGTRESGRRRFAGLSSACGLDVRQSGQIRLKTLPYFVAS
jgi:hypothetical protein